MKNLMLASLVFAAGCLAARAVETAASASGHWEGKIQMDATRELDMVIDLASDPQGVWTGTVSFPRSTARDIPFETITVKESTVTLEAHTPTRARFVATLSADGASLDGTAANEQGEAAFQLKRTGAAVVNLPRPSSPLPKDFAGMWEGNIEVQGQSRRVGFRLAEGADGRARATLISYTKGEPLEIPVTTVTIENHSLTFEVRAVSGTFTGTLAQGEIAGEWSQGPAKLPITFKSVPAGKPKP